MTNDQIKVSDILLIGAWVGPRAGLDAGNRAPVAILTETSRVITIVSVVKLT